MYQSHRTYLSVFWTSFFFSFFQKPSTSFQCARRYDFDWIQLCWYLHIGYPYDYDLHSFAHWTCAVNIIICVLWSQKVNSRVKRKKFLVTKNKQYCHINIEIFQSQPALLIAYLRHLVCVFLFFLHRYLSSGYNYFSHWFLLTFCTSP